MKLREVTQEELAQVVGGNHDSIARDNASSITPVFLKWTGHGTDTADRARAGDLVVDNPQDF